MSVSTILGQAEADDGVSIIDKEILDEWTIPFGQWLDQMVTWIFRNLGWALDAFKWPFETLLDLIVGDILEKISWLVVVIAFFIVGALVRNVKVGIFAALSLTLCGLLGPEYWIETARTIGFILVAVILCAAIGIPVGIACGRVDSFWNVVRPMLDAMQVVHSFVYMLPFIFFFGIGEVSATMVTMVFALPPLIRLTNLGIRQVPEDVVEAARAYGAPEIRVLVDVQMPLARPAIMTGLNQTLLLSISMLGIAAIMGAGGLGRLLFRAINQQDVGLATSAGLAFFLVAVVLDRISQPEASDNGGLAARIHRAWSNMRTPEVLVEDTGDTSRVAAPETDDGAYVQLTTSENQGLSLALVGAVLAFVAVFLTWGSDAGLISSHARTTDVDMAGQSFDGLAASGGSWFGYIVFGLALYTMLAAGVRRFKPTATSRWLSADGATIAGMGMLGAVITYLLASPGPEVVAYSDGIGAWLALVGSLMVAGGGGLAMWSAPYATKTPLPAGITWSRLVGGVIALLLIVVAVFSGWSFDERSGSGDSIPPEIQVQIDELKASALIDTSLASANANRVQSLLNQARNQGRKISDAFNNDGFELGFLTIAMALIAAAFLAPAAGLFGDDEAKRRRWSTLVVGMGVALMMLSLGLIASTTRVRDPQYDSGIGIFIVTIAGFFFVATSRSMLNVFDRAKSYTTSADELDPRDAALEPEAEVAGV